MLNNLSDVKKLINGVIEQGGQIRDVKISAEEFGEGYNVYVDVMYWQGSLLQESFTLAEEEKKSQAVARIKRAIVSLEKLGKTPKAWVMDGFGTKQTVEAK